tara:strand:- start:1382 stop:1654 length:273 start_codon:yes stop_codon:yes gene_type:complete
MIRGEKVPFTATEETARDAEEAAWEEEKPARKFTRLRMDRDRLLAETDFYANSDVTMSDDMIAYRKALRDLPASYDNSSVVGTITWPSKP